MKEKNFENNQKFNKKYVFLMIFLIIFLIFTSFLLISCGENISAEKIYFTHHEVSLFKNQTFKLGIEVLPEDANYYQISLTSSDPKIVSVNENGYLKAKNYGEVTITAQLKGSDVKDECHVVVNDGKVVDFDIKANNKTYFEGQSFDLSSLNVYAIYESGKEKTINADEYTVEYPETLSLENNEIKVTCNNKTKSYFAIVIKDFIIDMEVTTLPTKTSYIIGETFDNTGMEVSFIYASGKREISNEYIFDSSPLKYKQSKITISYSLFSKDIEISTHAQISVNTISNLQKAIDDGYTSIMLVDGSYNTSVPITISSKENLIIYGQTKNTSINGYNVIPISIEGDCGNINLYDLNLTTIGDTAPTQQINLSSCTLGNITLSNITYSAILQPEEIKYSLIVE